MKKIFVSLILVMILIVGCSNENKGDAILKETSLSDFQRNLITLGGGEAFFVHDVEILNDDVKEIKLYIDLYKEGEHIGTVSEMASEISEEEYQTVFLNLPSTDTERRWVSAVMTDGGYASGNGSNKRELEDDYSSAWGGVTGDINLSIGKEQPIASLVYSKKDSIGMIDDLSSKEAIQSQTDYEEVYIFSVELK